jgi:hypothetical protein
VLRAGFLGVAVAIDLHGDIRKGFRALAALFHSARLLNETDEEITAFLASAGVSPSSLNEVLRFSQRPEKDKSISAMGLREEGVGARMEGIRGTLRSEKG